MIDLSALSPEDRVLIERYAAAQKQPGAVKPAKYRSRPTSYNGRLYDSMAESARAAELDLLVKAGAIAWWLPQVRIRLGDDIVYVVDFLVSEAVWVRYNRLEKIHAEDVKGFETPRFRTCRSLWAKYGPFPLHVIFRGNMELVQGKPYRPDEV